MTMTLKQVIPTTSDKSNFFFRKKEHMFAVCVCLPISKFNEDAGQGRMVDLQHSAVSSNKVTRPHPKRY